MVTDRMEAETVRGPLCVNCEYYDPTQTTGGVDMRGPLWQPVCGRVTWRESSDYDLVTGEKIGTERLLGCNDERYGDEDIPGIGVAPSYPNKPEPCGMAARYFKPNAKYLDNWRAACGHAGVCPKCGGLAYQVWENLDKLECSKCDWTTK